MCWDYRILYVDISFYNITKFFKNIILHIELKNSSHRAGLQTSCTYSHVSNSPARSSRSSSPIGVDSEPIVMDMRLRRGSRSVHGVADLHGERRMKLEVAVPLVEIEGWFGCGADDFVCNQGWGHGGIRCGDTSGFSWWHELVVGVTWTIRNHQASRSYPGIVASWIQPRARPQPPLTWPPRKPDPHFTAIVATHWEPSCTSAMDPDPLYPRPDRAATMRS
jgi:hypothetical protein